MKQWDTSQAKSMEPEMTDKLDPRAWHISLTHENVLWRWSTSLPHDNHSWVWPTTITHENDSRELHIRITTGMIHKTQVPTQFNALNVIRLRVTENRSTLWNACQDKKKMNDCSRLLFRLMDFVDRVVFKTLSNTQPAITSSKLTIETLEQRHWCRCGIFIVNR